MSHVKTFMFHPSTIVSQPVEPQTVGQRLALLRAKLGSVVEDLSYNKFAAHIEATTGYRVTAKSLARWEQGIGEPSFEDAKAIAKASGVPASWLAWGADGDGLGPPGSETDDPRT